MLGVFEKEYVNSLMITNPIIGQAAFIATGAKIYKDDKLIDELSAYKVNNDNYKFNVVLDKNSEPGEYKIVMDCKIDEKEMTIDDRFIVNDKKTVTNVDSSLPLQKQGWN